MVWAILIIAALALYAALGLFTYALIRVGAVADEQRECALAEDES